jgi:branched-chain amino acid transport system ATP-binding protein
MQEASLLTVEHLTMQFGGLIAVNDVSFSIPSCAITALIGPNGAGKTTLFNCITGFYKPTKGHISITLPVSMDHALPRSFALEKLPTDQITRDAKIARTFQNIRLFTGMTVLENLMVAQHTPLMRASGYSLFGLLGLKRYKVQEQAAIEKARFWLDFVGLEHRADMAAGALSYGEQRRVEIARAMCTDPVLLCLDEPAAGLNPQESQKLNTLLYALRDEHKIAVLLIEHDMSVVMQVANQVVVLDYGRKIASGTPAQIRANPAVIAAYLGVDAQDQPPANLSKEGV